MISFFTKFKNIILIAIIACFLGSLGYVGVGAMNEAYGPNAPVAKVGKKNITYMEYDRALKNAYRNLEAQETEEADNLLREQVKQLVLQSLISQATFEQAGEELGLGISDMEIAYYIKNNPLFNTTGSFNKQNYLWIIRNRLGMNAEEFEEEVKNSKLAENYQKILVFAALPSPQEEAFVKANILKDKKADSAQVRAQKAQNLADNFGREFNQRNSVSFTKLAPAYQAD